MRIFISFYIPQKQTTDFAHFVDTGLSQEKDWFLRGYAQVEQFVIGEDLDVVNEIDMVWLFEPKPHDSLDDLSEVVERVCETYSCRSLALVCSEAHYREWYGESKLGERVLKNIVEAFGRASPVSPGEMDCLFMAGPI